MHMTKLEKKLKLLAYFKAEHKIRKLKNYTQYKSLKQSAMGSINSFV
jgi:hypothetical protein